MLDYIEISFFSKDINIIRNEKEGIYCQKIIVK